MQDLFGEFRDIVKKTEEMKQQAFDNLFNANHRNEMISRYGHSDAMVATIDDLHYLRGPFAMSDRTRKEWLP